MPYVSSLSSDVRTDSQRFRWSVLVVTLSLLIPGIALGFLVAYEISQGEFSHEHTEFSGVLKDGSLWYQTLKTKGAPFFPTYEHVLRRLDLATGKVTDPGLPSLSNRPTVIWVDDALFVGDFSTFYEISDGKLTPLPAINLVGNRAFEYEGKLTVIAPTTKALNSNLHLTHWINGKWTIGREIVLPSVRQVWRHDADQNRYYLSPEGVDNSRPYAWYDTHVSVARQGDRYHVLLRSPTYDFVAYRTGFEFADELPESVSALEPENGRNNSHGWEPVYHNEKDFLWSGLTCDRQGPLFFSQYTRPRVVRRRANGEWKELLFENGQRLTWGFFSLAASSAEEKAYAIIGDRGESFEILPVSENVIQPPTFKYSFSPLPYILRWSRILAEVFCVWVLHLIVVAGSVKFATRNVKVIIIEPGNHQRRLALPVRRAAATLIDALLVYVVLWIVWMLWKVVFFGPSSFNGIWSLQDLFGSFRCLEGILNLQGQRPSELLRNFFYSPFGLIAFPLMPDTGFFGAMIAIFVCLGCSLIFFEGRYGITPGKQLMNLRTCRTSLRPCGIPRAIARYVMRAFDLPLGLTPIPAAISLIYSDRQQRFGDRLADTIVIDADSEEEIV